MAFGKVTKEDLKEAGLDPEEFKALIGKSVNKEELTALKTEILTTVTDQIKNGFTELESKLKTSVSNNNSNNNTKSDKDGNLIVEEVTDQERFLTDPAKYVKDEVSKVGIAAAIEFKKMSRDLAYNSAKSTMIGFRNPQLKKEIDDEWAKYTPEKMAQFGSDPAKLIEQIHNSIIGLHHDDIVADRDKKDGKFNIVHSDSSSSSSSSSTSSSSNMNKKVLTEAEKIAAKKFGMTEDEWIKQGEEMDAEELTRHSVGV